MRTRAMPWCSWLFLAALWLPLAPCLGKDIAIFHECYTGSLFACMARDAAARLRVSYPSQNIMEPVVTGAACAAYLNSTMLDIVVVVGFGFTLCAAEAAKHPATWFITIDVCDYTGPNIICGVFDEGQVAYAVGYLAGLVTKTKVVAAVGGIPIPPVKSLFNGFRLGTEASCPDCRVEGVMVHSFAHPEGANVSAEQLVEERGADVVFGCGGYTGSMAILRSAQLGAMVIGVDTDEFASTFASPAGLQVRSRIMTSAGKKVDVAVEKSIPLVLDVPPGGFVDGVSGAGLLTLDYANGAIGMSDCHMSCDLVGAASWQRAKSVERDLAAGLVKVPLASDGTILLPGGEPNSFAPMPFAGRAPQGRVQHAMASFSTAWQTHVAVFGGAGSSGPLNDLWLYTVDFATWWSSDTGITVGTPPPPLVKACAIGLGESVIIFGGRTQDSQQSSIAYSFSDEPDFLGFSDQTSPLIRYTWAQLNTTGPAPAVEGPGCTMLNATCMVVFGGRAQFADHADVHMLCVDGNGAGRWTKVWPPPGGAGAAGTSPDPREGAGVAVVSGASVGLDGLADVLLVLGGTSGGNARSDAWAFVLAQAAWIRLPDLPVPVNNQPLVFTMPGSQANQTCDVVVIQLTSSFPGLGLGALTLDLAARTWSPQPAALAGAGANASLMSQAAATRAGGRTWLFGGSSNQVLLPPDLRAAAFAFEKGCSPGQQAFGIRCVNCSVGTFSPGGRGATCRACDLGKAAALPGASECTACAVGYYSNELEGSACKACPAGTSTQGLRGESSCLDCGPGQVSGEGFSMCALCEKGKYAPSRRTTSCTPCPGDLTTADPGANDLDQCACPGGTYRPLEPEQRSSCSPCPAGMECEMGSDLRFLLSNDTVPGPYPKVMPGGMSLADNPLEVFSCVHLEHCPGGAPATCAPRRDADKIACGTCQAGSFQKGMNCVACKDTDAVPILFAIFAGLIALGVTAVAVNRNIVIQTNGTLSTIVAGGLVFTGIQTMGIFAQLTIRWFEPVSAIFAIMNLLSFDLEVLRVSCVLGEGPVEKFAFRQCIAPVCACVLLIMLFFKKRMKRSTTLLIEYVNSVGTLYNVFFISIILSGVSPWVCYKHPSGHRFSMRTNPSVLCFEGGAHDAMIAIGLSALFLVPLPFASAAAYLTFQYPRIVSGLNPHGVAMFQAGRFLFFKFKPTSYYFGLILLLRSLLICLIPVAVRDEPAVQVVLMCAVLCSFALLQQADRPWRSELCNSLDGALSLMTVLLLTTGAMVLGLTASMQAVAILGTLTIIAFLVLAALGVIAAFICGLRPRPFYHRFICHHKADAAAQARLLKIMLQAKTGQSVFIDSDDLKDLDQLFDIVRSRVTQLIVYLTRGTLSRPWCAGEIVTAFGVGRVKVIAVYTPSFVPPTEGDLGSLEMYLDLTSCNLVHYGMTLQNVEAAFRELLDDNTACVRMEQDKARAGSKRFEAVVNEILVASSFRAVVSLQRSLMASVQDRPPDKQSTADKPGLPELPNCKGKVLISAEPGNDEALAAAGILINKIQTQIMAFVGQGICLLNDYRDDDRDLLLYALARVRAIVVLLSSGTLQSSIQLFVMTEATSSNRRGTTTVIPVSLPGFTFPTKEYYTDAFPKAHPGEVDKSQERLKMFFRLVAAPFLTSATDQVLDAQARELVERIPKGLPAGGTCSVNSQPSVPLGGFQFSNVLKASAATWRKKMSVEAQPAEEEQESDECN